MPIAIELPGLGNGYRLGAGVRVTSGAAAGRQLYCTASAGDMLFCDGRAEANLVRFGGVRSEEHTSELLSLMRISYAVFCLKKKRSRHILKQLKSVTTCI